MTTDYELENIPFSASESGSSIRKTSRAVTNCPTGPGGGGDERGSRLPGDEEGSTMSLMLPKVAMVVVVDTERNTGVTLIT